MRLTTVTRVGGPVVCSVVLVLCLAGCGAGGAGRASDGSPTPSRGGAATPGTGSPGTGTPGAGPPGPSGTTSPGVPDHPAPAAPTGPGRGPGQSDPDRPRDLVAGQVHLTGTVERRGDCVMLRSGADRWALLRAPSGLRDGAAVQVIGRRATAPRDCSTTLAVTVSTVRPH